MSDFEPATVGDLLDELTTWAETEVVDALDRSPRIETAAGLVHRIQRARAALGLAEDLLADFLLDTAGTGLHEHVDGVPPFEVRVGRDRKEWQHDAVVRDLVPAVTEALGIAGAVNTDGERIEPAAAVRDVIESFRESSSDGWKVTGLRKFGLDPEDYCKSSRGRVSVNFP